MRLYLILRKVEVKRGFSLRWRAFSLCSTIVNYRISTLKVTYLPGAMNVKGSIVLANA